MFYANLFFAVWFTATFGWGLATGDAYTVWVSAIFAPANVLCAAFGYVRRGL